MLHVIANAQKRRYGLAAFIDAEYALDPGYAVSKLGVNLDDLLVSQPDSGEEALSISGETLARSKRALDAHCG